MRWLLDTSICIYLIKKKPSSVIAQLESHPLGEVGVSSVTVAELCYGVEKSSYPSRNREALERFLIPLAIADFDYLAAEAYGEIRATLEALGMPIGPLDMLIAAHAVSLGAALVTNNVQEFARIPNLKITNWVTE